ncbi:hypothetical protein BDW60DRAFT_201075 [Aspergillus nidulans var. acristatus]
MVSRVDALIPLTMDLFTYNPTYQVWICTSRRCQYAVTPQTLLTHLQVCHCWHATVATVTQQEAALTKMLKQPWIDPAKQPVVTPSPADPPILGLPVHQGYRCPHCPYIALHCKSMQRHRSQRHQDLETPQHPGAQPRYSSSHRLLDQVVFCQQLFPLKTGSHYFEVCPT